MINNENYRIFSKNCLGFINHTVKDFERKIKR